MAALGTTAPVLSVMVPASAPRSDCAMAAVAQRKPKMQAIRIFWKRFSERIRFSMETIDLRKLGASTFTLARRRTNLSTRPRRIPILLPYSYRLEHLEGKGLSYGFPYQLAYRIS